MAERRIRWHYTHSLNKKSKIRRRKDGEYFGKVKHTYKHWLVPRRKQLALVHFDGNKWSSRVPYDELEFREARDEN